MNYKETLILVSPDCPVTQAETPTAKQGQTPVHVIQHELLRQHPYTFTGEELLFQTHVRRLGLEPAEVERRRDELWADLFSKDHACLRASSLGKRYGWGFHFDEHGRIGMYAMESDEYARYSQDPAIKAIPAMRSARK